MSNWQDLGIKAQDLGLHVQELVLNVQDLGTSVQDLLSDLSHKYHDFEQYIQVLAHEGQEQAKILHFNAKILLGNSPKGRFGRAV
jgi:hypothetical protein